jgi:hypothetical protein
MTLLVTGLDVTLKSETGWEFNLGSASSEQLLEFAVVDDICWLVVFCYPLD